MTLVLTLLSVNSSNSQRQPDIPPDSGYLPEDNLDRRTTNSMDEYFRLKQSIFLITVIMTVIIFILVWAIYSLSLALNYLIGACVGIVYLRMLAKDVEKIGGDNVRVSSGRLALFAGMIIVAAQWDQLQIFPVFLGFLTYKIAIIAYVLLPNSSGVRTKADLNHQ